MQPSPVNLGHTHDLALSALEAAEYRSLSWGLVDGSLAERDAEAAIAAALVSASQGGSPGQILDDLVEARLVRMWRAPQRRYRTRFSELVRLLVRSRQLFDGRPWRAAPNLVSDFRVDIRPRGRPRPDTDPATAFDGLAGAAGLNGTQRAVWLAVSEAARGFRLRRFQVDAARRLLEGWGEHGTIVTAGTGSGKTIAFYLPALVAMSDGLTAADHWVRALCIYPRQELLKDQFSEALRLAKLASATLRGAGRREFALGALYSGTPRSATPEELGRAGWRRVPTGFVCPFLRCTVCAGDLVWKDADVSGGRELLRCASPGCDNVLGDDHVRLTRASILRQPPDLLFTTTEMLNQRLSDTRFRALFGIGKPKAKRPLFVLLDEIHTYSGTSGAQAALLLRRWRHMLDSPVRWVGLSATLREASAFFADLTGLRPDAVVEVTPAAEDLDWAGAEYQLVLRADPSSQAATLSTSIQAAMLMARMLDGHAPGPSQGRVGRRLFAFTDDLDVTHRLFDDLRDAEAYDRFGRPDARRRTLSALRSDREPDADAREADGQRWALAEQLRGSLERRLVVGRTTSRDPGVDGTADVIIATSALEVGFNDPDVGAVLQHKAPRSFAAFLQRRGRAGRRTDMRPITVTVLSDYGRDRVAFQAFEHLFDPLIERQSLPIRNSYVLRIQAAYSFLDWLAARIASEGVPGWAWDTLSAPPSRRASDNTSFRRRAKSLVQSLTRLDEGVVADLSEHLRGALRLSDGELRAVLWEPPRSLLLEAVPTLARRLFRDWELAQGGGLDLTVDYHPLPDFVPRTLFDDLNLPEVLIDVPAATVRDEPKVESMPVLQALNQFAPGRVRRRFADEYAGLAHWIPVPLSGPQVDFRVGDYAPEHEFVGTFRGRTRGEMRDLRVYRPWRLRVVRTPQSILPTSHAAWDWQSSFDFLGNPVGVDLPQRSGWAAVTSTLEFFLHRFSAAVSQRRFASEGASEVRQRQGALQVQYRVVDADGEPAAIGFAFEADALVVPLVLPSAEDLAARTLPSRLERWLRTLRLRRAIAHDALLPAEVNLFQRDWLFQVLLLSVVRRARQDGCTFASAAEALAAEGDPTAFRSAVAAIVSSDIVDDEHGGDGSRLAQTLEDILALPGVVARLGELAREAAQLSGGQWGAWIREMLLVTVVEASLQACLIAVPADTAIGGLTVDAVERNGTPAAVIAESTQGGGGTIEALARTFAADPRSFEKAIDAALAPSDLETAADGLERTVRLAVQDAAVRAAIARLRDADGPDARSEARDAFIHLLAQRGVAVPRALSVSIATRLLRPAASPATDQLTLELLEAWSAAEANYGMGLPVRVAAALGAMDQRLSERLRQAAGAPGIEIGTANLLLWPRGGELRLGALQSHNPYRRSPLTDAMLARCVLLDGRTPTIDLSDADWGNKLESALASGGEARLRADASDARRLRAELVRLLAKPIEVGYLRLYPALDGLRREDDGRLAAELSVREQA